MAYLRSIPLAVLAVLVGAGTACSSGDDETGPSTTAAEAAEADTTTSVTDTRVAPQLPVNVGDGTFAVGTLLPASGVDAALGPATAGAAQLAVDDINAAGGVLGREVLLLPGDSGDDTSDIAQQSVDRLINEGADVIVGAVADDVSARVIDKIIGSNVIQFSPANTALEFTEHDDEGMYFRTAPSVALQAAMVADVVLADGHPTAVVVHEDDSHGNELADRFADRFAEVGGELLDRLPYQAGAANWSSIVNVIATSGTEAVVLLGGEDSAAIVEEMHTQGVGPDSLATYGIGTNTRGLGPAVGDPAVLAGFTGVEPGLDTDELFEFTQQVDDRAETAGVYTWAAETYDAVIITALASEIAGIDEPSAVAEQIVDVTRGGVPCSSFLECRELAIGGEDIAYVGQGGGYVLTDTGDPTEAGYRVVRYAGATEPDPGRDEYRFFAALTIDG